MKNSGHDYRFRVPPAGAGATLSSYLAARFRHTSSAEWRARIAAGSVTLDGEIASPDAALHAGQTLLWHRPPWVEPAAPLRYQARFADAELIVVDKPAGLPTLPGAGYLEHTLHSLVRRDFPDAAAAHRLGRWTSGLVVFGLTRAARRALARQFASGQPLKRYRTIAGGNPSWRRRRIAVPIGPLPYAPLGRIHAADSRGRPARSSVRVIRRRGREFVCEVTIATGRPHQIRIHLATVGHPLVGDPLYARGGRPAPDCSALPGDPGYRLHATVLRFAHPRTGLPVRIESAPPRSWDQPAAGIASRSSARLTAST